MMPKLRIRRMGRTTPRTRTLRLPVSFSLDLEPFMVYGSFPFHVR